MSRRRAPLQAPPLAVQMLGLVLGGLVAAQAATFAMSTLLPGPLPARYSVPDIARALRGGPLRLGDLPPLQRGSQARAPDPHSPGWQVSEPARRDLAGALGVDPAEVALLFYSPPPFAGADGRRGEHNDGGGGASLISALFAPSAWAQPPGGMGGAMGGPGGFPGGGSIGGGFPGQSGQQQDPGGSPRGSGQRSGGRGGMDASRGGAQGGGEGGPGGQVFEPSVAPVPQGAPDAASPIPQGGGAGRTGGAPTGAPGGPAVSRPEATIQPGYAPVLVPSVTGGGLSTASGAAASPDARSSIEPPLPPPRQALGAAKVSTLQPPALALSSAGPAAMEAPAKTNAPATDGAVAGASTPSAVQTIAPPISHSLFGATQPPMVDGEFLAALRTAPGQWVTVRPLQDPLLSRWQRRLGLWFLAAFAVAAPLGWWMSRRLAAPLATLAAAAEQLGRDPATAVPQGGGAPEIRQLASALAGMQARLQRHVEDRTAMVGAISHDLRTPLARMRFKLERAPPQLQASILRDMAHMQEMLDAVLLFIRDASGPSPRETVDLRSIVECVVDDAALVGGDAALESGGPAAVHVDITGVQRVVTNLVENALKYGGQARVRLRADGADAIVEVQDQGPGLPPEEIEQVFQPFYRSEAGRRANAKGIGLGLPVSRSIARAHGGDVVLRNGPAQGLLAELRVPLALAPAGQATTLASAA